MVHCTMPKPRIIALHKSAWPWAPGLEARAAAIRLAKDDVFDEETASVIALADVASIFEAAGVGVGDCREVGGDERSALARVASRATANASQPGSPS
jgi:hypothetical protein